MVNPEQILRNLQGVHYH